MRACTAVACQQTSHHSRFDGDLHKDLQLFYLKTNKQTTKQNKTKNNIKLFRHTISYSFSDSNRKPDIWSQRPSTSLPPCMGVGKFASVYISVKRGWQIRGGDIASGSRGCSKAMSGLSRSSLLQCASLTATLFASLEYEYSVLNMHPASIVRYKQEKQVQLDLILIYLICTRVASQVPVCTLPC